jgi:hypothetical protein
VRFGANFRITDASFPAAFGQDPSVNLTYMGDYDQAVADNNYFYTTWGDNRLADASHAHQPDVRFARIPVTGLVVAAFTLPGTPGPREVVVSPSTGARAKALAAGFGAGAEPSVAAFAVVASFTAPAVVPATPAPAPTETATVPPGGTTVAPFLTAARPQGQRISPVMLRPGARHASGSLELEVGLDEPAPPAWAGPALPDRASPLGLFG